MYRQLLLSVLCIYLWAYSIDATTVPESRIVGGSNATFYECSHAVAIRQVNRDFLYNGVLISPRDVLTAASCVYNGNTLRNASDLLVVAGTIINNPTTRTGDIAVLRLNSSLATGGIASIAIANLATQLPAVNQTCSLCGWGSTITTGPAATILQTININVQSSSSPNCTRAAGGAALPAHAICAGDPLQPGRGACTNDGGAPMFDRRRTDLLLDKQCILIGWGANGTQSGPVELLQEAYVRVVAKELCSDGMICVKGERERAGACRGDLGASLLCDGSVAGILTDDPKECGGHISAFGGVRENYKWIRAQISASSTVQVLTITHFSIILISVVYVIG